MKTRLYSVLVENPMGVYEVLMHAPNAEAASAGAISAAEDSNDFPPETTCEDILIFEGEPDDMFAEDYDGEFSMFVLSVSEYDEDEV